MKKILLQTIALLGFGLMAQAQVMYVDADATGNNDGTSWANAYDSLEDALNDWDIINFPSGVWVAEGIYKPSSQTASFKVSGANMYGGFDGTETSLSQRNPKTHLTILSGDILGNDNGNITWTETTRSDNAFTILYGGAGGKIDGFIIEGGNAADNTSSSEFHYMGAAIYHFNNPLDISNCVFRNNTGWDNVIIHFRAATGYNSQQNIYNCEFYNNQGYENLIGTQRPNNLTRGHNMRLFNNLFHHNVLVKTNGSIVYINSYENGGSLNSGSFSCKMYNNTFVNNTVPGGTFGFGTAFNNQPFSMNCNLSMDLVGNIFWDDNGPLVRKSRLIPNDLVNSDKFYFIANLMKDTTTITETDLYADLTFLTLNQYNVDPMFVDTAARDYNITSCSSPVNDAAAYILSQHDIPAALFNVDFYGNTRQKGQGFDIGHCEVQTEATPITAQQVGQTIVADAGYSSYAWYFDQGAGNYVPVSGTTNTITPSNGDGTYVVSAEDAGGCSTYITVNFCSSVTVTVTLVGDSLVAEGIGGDGFSLYLDGNFVSANNTGVFYPTETGDYTISHYITGGGTCSGSATITIGCSNVPVPVISQNNSALSVNDIYVSYQWYKDGNAINGATSATYTPTADGDYDVEVVGAFNCAVYSNTYSFCSGFSLTISQNGAELTAASGYSNYQWYLDGVEIIAANTETYTATEDGVYTCEAEDNGCTGTSNAITVDLVNGVNEIAFTEVNIYPNPTTGIVNIALNGQNITAIRLFDLTSKLVKQLHHETTQFNISDLEQGIYFLEISNAEQRSVFKVALR